MRSIAKTYRCQDVQARASRRRTKDRQTWPAPLLVKGSAKRSWNAGFASRASPHHGCRDCHHFTALVRGSLDVALVSTSTHPAQSYGDDRLPVGYQARERTQISAALCPVQRTRGASGGFEENIAVKHQART